MVYRVPIVLKQHMEQHNLSQRELADKIGLSESAVSRLLNQPQRKGFEFETINAICLGLGVTPNDLLWEVEQ